MEQREGTKPEARSTAIALRDIAALVERGIPVRNPEGGRSTSYSIAKIN
jgi:hypothetical protein